MRSDPYNVPQPEKLLGAPLIRLTSGSSPSTHWYQRLSDSSRIPEGLGRGQNVAVAEGTARPRLAKL